MNCEAQHTPEESRCPPMTDRRFSCHGNQETGEHEWRQHMKMGMMKMKMMELMMRNEGVSPWKQSTDQHWKGGPMFSADDEKMRGGWGKMMKNTRCSHIKPSPDGTISDDVKGEMGPDAAVK